MHFLPLLLLLVVVLLLFLCPEWKHVTFNGIDNLKTSKAELDLLHKRVSIGVCVILLILICRCCSTNARFVQPNQAILTNDYLYFQRVLYWYLWVVYMIPENCTVTTANHIHQLSVLLLHFMFSPLYWIFLHSDCII